MNYELHKRHHLIFLGVEASFTLIDFLLFFSSFLLGFVFAMFFLIFAFAVLQKIFSRYEFEFNTDEYSITKYYKIFGYFRFRMQKLGFGEVEQFLLSNHHREQALFSKGMATKEWFTLDVRTKNGYMRLVKCEEEELEELYALYSALSEKLELYFAFNTELGRIS